MNGIALSTQSRVEPRNIRKLRESFGDNQSQFAHRLNVSARTIQLWESGKIKPAGKNADALGKILTLPHATPALTATPTPTPVGARKRWNVGTGERVANPAVDAFLAALISLCAEHKMLLVPEDDAVESEVRPFDEPTAAVILRSQMHLNL